MFSLAFSYLYSIMGPIKKFWDFQIDFKKQTS